MAEQKPDLDALLTLSYGLYIVSSCSNENERINGLIGNTIMQISDSPPWLAVAINRQSLTYEYISRSGVCAVTVLAETAPRKLISLFGFRSGRDIDKFSQVSREVFPSGCPIILEHALAGIDIAVKSRLDCGAHSLFVGEIVGAKIIGQGSPMTYAYYREVLSGKTPPTAPSYRPTKAPALPQKKKETATMKKYVCNVCGYIYDPAVGDPENGVKVGTAFENLPDDWVCPECGVGKDEFSPVE